MLAPVRNKFVNPEHEITGTKCFLRAAFSKTIEIIEHRVIILKT